MNSRFNVDLLIIKRWTEADLVEPIQLAASLRSERGHSTVYLTTTRARQKANHLIHLNTNKVNAWSMILTPLKTFSGHVKDIYKSKTNKCSSRPCATLRKELNKFTASVFTAACRTYVLFCSSINQHLLFAMLFDQHGWFWGGGRSRGMRYTCFTVWECTKHNTKTSVHWTVDLLTHAITTKDYT